MSLSTHLKRIVAFFRLLHIKQIKGFPSPSPSSGELVCCQNCGTLFTDNYCHRCGQSRKTSRLTFRSILSNIVAGAINISNGFGRTLVELIIRPGYMIADYIDGKRVRYFPPFQTLFVLAAIYVLLAQLVILPTQKEIQKETQTTKDNRKELVVNIDSAELSEDSTYTPDAIGRSIQSVIRGAKKVSQIPALNKVGNLLQNWAHGNKALLILAVVPILTAATRIAFRKRKHRRDYNLTEHLLSQIYIASQLLLFSILYIPFNEAFDENDVFDIPWWLIFMLYMWDYKQLFRCTWLRTLGRTAMMFALSLLMIVVLAIAIGASLYFSLMWLGSV
ncbi:MAG: DUF3667 domain-containing protein [Mediterranea sp.]|jgi:cytochrome bd-type quinol oxidase subunit 2|nr:DUF3667 domain-containing protein [Mediterranea sp.]